MELCTILADHQRLNEINLAKNNITSLSCKGIAQLIAETFYLESINLHWNSIKAEGANMILHALARNSNVKIVDLSWNIIGSNNSKEFAIEFSKLLGSQESLLHVDISHNRIDTESCRIISEGLKQNHSLWGLHIMGNEGKVDTKGFLLSGKLEHTISMEQFARRINGRSMVQKPVIEDEKTESDNCWICEGWNEVLFEWPPSKFNQF